MAVAIIALVIALAGAIGTIYSVVISHRALEWQQEQDRQRTTPSIEIETEHIVVGGDRRGPQYRLRVSVVNNGETVEQLKGLTVWDAKKWAGKGLMSNGDDYKLEPRGRYVGEVTVQDIPNWQSGFYVIADLVGRESVESRVEEVKQDMIEMTERR